MSTNHYVVSQRDSAWQYSNRGEITGPFGTKELAVEAAIEAASVLAESDAEVLVRDSNLKTETVWRRNTSSSS